MLPKPIRTLWQYLRAPVAQSSDSLQQSIHDEIAFHIAERAAENLARGMSEEDARQAAVSRFGNPALVAADCQSTAASGLWLWHWLHLGMTAVLAVAVAAIWWGGRTQEQAAAKLPPGIASMLDNDWTGDIAGKVVDETGRPLEQAHLLVVVKTWPDQSYFQRAYLSTTDQRGEFRIEDVYPLNDRYEVQIAAVADRRVLRSTYHGDGFGSLPPVVLTLPPSTGMTLQVESETGALLRDIEVLPQGRIEANGEAHLIYFDSAQSLVRRTDVTGCAELPYFQPGDTARLLLRVAKGEWIVREVVVPPAGQNATVQFPNIPVAHLKES